MVYYSCKGEIRGDCGHKHKTPEAAFKCLKEDQVGCKAQGGYSDRVVVRYSDNGEPINQVEGY